MIESVLAVVAGDGQETRGGQALVKGIGKGVADPGEVSLASAVVKGEDKHYAATGIRHFTRWGGL
jgi:hypothetical protein